jgi:hypothetical protein
MMDESIGNQLLALGFFDIGCLTLNISPFPEAVMPTPTYFRMCVRLTNDQRFLTKATPPKSLSRRANRYFLTHFVFYNTYTQSGP